MRIRCFLGLAFMSGLTAFGQQYPEFTQWMKATDQAAGGLRKMEKKVGPQAMRSAEVIGGVYEEMIGFFRQQGRQNAIKWAQDGKAAATALATAAYKEDAEGAEAAFKAVSATCRPCHDAYRERTPDGKFRWKSAQEPKP